MGRAVKRVRGGLGRVAELSGFPRSIFMLFLVLAVALGLLLSWAFNLSVQVNSPSVQGTADGSAQGVGADGSTVLTEYTLGSEVQLLVDTGTLQNPASFDFTKCVEELGITNSVLMLEQVQWASAGPAWLIVHGDQPLTQYRTDGGNVSVAVVRSTCGDAVGMGGAGGAPTTSPAVLWEGSVVIAPLAR